MKLFEVKRVCEVESVEMGYSPIGNPMMTARLYRVGSLLIDTGIRHCQKEVLAWIKDQSISKILLTHHHEDHTGNAAAIRQIKNPEIYGHPITVEKMRKPFSIFPYQHLIWGSSSAVLLEPYPSVIEDDKYRFTPIFTPGHARDHTVYLEPNYGWLFSGDLYLADKIKYFRADEILVDQINSLKTILKYDFESLFCAHNPKLKQGKKHLERKLDFLESIFQQVAFFHQKGQSRHQIMKSIGIKEVRLVKWMCAGNVKAEHIVQSALEGLMKSNAAPHQSEP